MKRCFRCQRNFNPIEFVMVAEEFTFVEAVEFLRPLLNRARRQPSSSATPQDPDIETPSSVS